MNILITGLPGSGKGTQSELINDFYNIGHLSTGNVFRNQIQNETSLGKELASYMNEGKLVPDELTISILKEEIKLEKYSTGFLLDGFPRTIAQAEFLDQMLADENTKLDLVLELVIDENVIIDRITKRQVCPECGATYHMTSIPSKVEGICDKCGSALIQREDDTVEKVATRLSVAKEQTVPVINYYKEQNIVTTITMDVTDSASEVFENIKKAIDGINNN